MTGIAMHHWLMPAAVAFVCWGIWAFFPKLTTRYIDPKSAIIYESIGGLMVALIVLGLIAFKPAADGRGALLAIITGMLGIGGALAYLFAVLKGPVSLISVITALYPILTIALAYFFLHEPISLKQGFGMILGLIAIILIGT